jgi:hypothetical protein
LSSFSCSQTTPLIISLNAKGMRPYNEYAWLIPIYNGEHSLIGLYTLERLVRRRGERGICYRACEIKKRGAFSGDWAPIVATVIFV